MDPAPTGDPSHKRASSRSQSANVESDPLNSRRKFKRRNTNSLSEPKPDPGDDTQSSSMSDSEHELDALGSEVEGDEETGLSGEERRKFLQQKRRRNRLDTRIAGADAMVSGDDARQADKYVVRKLVINAALIGLWYFFSLSISLYNKWMFAKNQLNFPFPLFTTSLHMLVQFILASSILLIFPSFRPKRPQPSPHEPFSTNIKPIITPLFYLTRLIPTGTTTSLDIGLGNTSLRYITLTFYTMCKSSVLIFVLIFAFLFRLETPSWKLILIISSMTLGVLMMVAGETSFDTLGFALAISASFFSGFRWAVTQILLLRHPATSNPFATLFLLAPIMFVTLFSIALVSETPSALIDGLYKLQETKGTFEAVVLMFIPGFLAFCMISAEFTLLQRTNVVTLSICGIFKEVVTISAAGIAFHDKLSLLNICGLLVTIVSIASYNYIKVEKMRREAREKLTNKKVDDIGDSDDEEDHRLLGHGRRGRGRRTRSRKSSTSGRVGPTDGADIPLIYDGDEEGRHNHANNRTRTNV